MPTTFSPSTSFHRSLPRAIRLALVGTALLPLTFMNAAKEPSRPADKTPTDNPLLSESTLPYQMPPFDKIKSEHFSPAFAVALAEHLDEEVDAITKETKEEPTFENTIVALEKGGPNADACIGNTFFEPRRRAHQPRPAENRKQEMLCRNWPRIRTRSS